MRVLSADMLLLLIIVILSVSIMISNFSNIRNEYRAGYSSSYSRFSTVLLVYSLVLLCILCGFSMIFLRNVQISDEDDLSSKIVTISEELSTSSTELINVVIPFTQPEIP